MESLDITQLIVEAQTARSIMQDKKKKIKGDIRRKYEAAIAMETAEATQEAEYDFARTLARVHAAGVSQAILRRQVLRTNVWDVWTYWRDLAQIEPERVTIRAAKEGKDKQKELLKRGFEWNSEYSLLTVYKLPDRELPHPFILSNFGVLGERTDIELPPKIIRGLEEKGIRIPLIRFLTHLVRDAVDSGLVPPDRMVSTDETIARTEADNPFYVVEKRVS